MNGALKKTIQILLVCWASWHLLATAVYSLQWPVKGWLSSTSYQYMVPLFHQNWSLFAPNIPEYDAQLIYRFGTDSISIHESSWKDATAAHGSDDFSKMETIEQNILVQFAYQMHSNYYSLNGQPQLDALLKTPAYSKALYYAGRMHEGHGGQWSAIQIATVFRFPLDQEKAPSSACDTIVFPVFYKNDIQR